MANYSTRVLSTEAELASLAPDWVRCLLRQRRPHFEAHPAYFDIESRRTGDKLVDRFVVALHRGSELVGVAPFLVRRWTWNCRLGYTKVARFPVYLADLCGETLMAPDDLEAQRVLMDAVASASVPYQMVLLESLPVDSPLWQLLMGSQDMDEHFWTHQAGVGATHRMIEMPPTFAEYLTQFSSKRRKAFGYNLRRLERICSGKLRMDRFRTPEEVPGFMARASEVSIKSWQGASLGKILETNDAEVAFCRDMAGCGWFRSYLLSDGDRPIAFVLGVQVEGTYYYNHIGYDPRYAEYSPGTVLLYQLLEDLFADDSPKWVDFRYGDGDYKRLFSNHAYQEANLYLLRRSAYTAVARATHTACDVVGRAVRAGLDKLGMRERARHLLRARALKASQKTQARPVAQGRAA